MKKTGQQEVVGFQFQEIPLEEALNVVLAGNGFYSDVKQTLLAKLPTLAQDKAFAFGLPNGKDIDEKRRRELCSSVNKTFKIAKLDWKIAYSGTRKLFICVPKQPQEIVPHANNGYIPKSKWNKKEDFSRILQLRDQGLTVKQIIDQTHFSRGRVAYVSYQLNPQHPRKVQPDTNDSDTLGHLLEVAKKVFKVSDFRNVAGIPFRNAISVVGMRDLKLSAPKIAPFLGISREGVYFHGKLAKNQNAKSIEKIALLRKAIKQEG